MRRLAYILDSNAIGGTEVHLLTLLRHLDRGQYAPTVILASHDRGRPFGRLLEDAGIAVRYHPMPRDKRDVGTLAGLVRLLRRLGPHVVHVHLPFTLDNRYAFVAARAAGCPAVLSTEHLTARPEVFRSLRARVVKRALAALQDRIIVPCGHVGTQLVALAGVPGRKIVTVNYGIEVPGAAPASRENGIRVELGLAPQTPLVGMVARIDPRQKRFDDFLVAAQEVGRAVPAAHFLVVGDGEPRHRDGLKTLAGTLGLGERVHFLGFRRDAAQITAGLDVFVLASDNEACLPIAALEAMARGAPVVISDLGGAHEQVLHGETGYLAPARDPAAIARMTLALLQRPSAARDITQRARRLIEERFSAAAMAGRIQALYGRLLAEKSRPGAV